MNSIIYKSVNNDFQVIDLNKEYAGYTGSYPFAIATELTEDELNNLYADEVEAYRPFIIINNEMFEAMRESNLNDERERKRNALYHDAFALDEERHPVDTKSDFLSYWQSLYTMELIINKMMELPGRQGQRMYKHYILGYTTTEVARSEGVLPSTVRQSICRGKAAMRKIFSECGVIS